MKKLSLTLIFLIVFSAIAYLYIPPYLSTTSNKNIVEITIPQGASLNHVSQLLYNKQVIKSKLWFKYKAQSEKIDKKIRPGTYTFNSNISIDEIFELIQQGGSNASIVLTIPEGFTIYQIAQRIESSGLGKVEDFIATTKKYFKEKGYDFPTEDIFYEMEGYLYPDTYYFNAEQDMMDIVGTLAQTMDKVFTDEYKSKAKEMDLSLHQVLTIASLIEREAYSNEEMSKISGVIYNRIKKNMLLGIDATVIYGIGKGEKHINRVLYSHLEDPSPFNTYQHLGLPPGPIAAPSKAAINAALYPEKHDYLYYVLSEDGHVFNRTYEEHKVDADKYHKSLK